MRLTFLDNITCERAAKSKEVGFPLYLAVPHVGVVLADIHENAHFRDCLKLCCAWFPIQG